jgi:hypothetical protein
VETKQTLPAFIPQPSVPQPTIQSTPKFQPPPQIQPGFGQANIDLSAPVPIRAKKSPVLKFQPTVAPVDNSQNPQVQELPKFSMPINNRQFQPPPFVPAETGPGAGIDGPLNLAVKNDAPTIALGSQMPPPAFQEKISSDTERVTRRQSMFEQQEKLLREQLTLQERERQTKLNLTKQEQETAEQLAQKNTLERQLLRQKEASILEAQKMASIKREERQAALNEKRKAHREKTVQFYATEIVNSIVQEHVLELNATILAVEFHRKALLRRVLRKVRKVGARSVRRKQIQLEEIAQTRVRKNLLTRARAELDNKEVSSGSKRLRRRSLRQRPLENEDEFDKLLVKVDSALVCPNDRRVKSPKNCGGQWMLISF